MTTTSDLDVRHPRTLSRTLDLLLVEDSEPDAILTQHQLDNSDLAASSLQHVSTLDEALGWLLAHPVDCVLLDLSLPDADGVEGVGAVSTLSPGTPIVVLTGNRDETLQVEALEMGAEDYLVKGESTSDSLSRAIRYSISRKGVELELARRKWVDPLTGLMNEASVRKAIDQRIAASEPCGAFLTDIHSMRELNKEHGHRGSDRLLIGIATMLARLFGRDDQVARYGAKFMVLCPGRTDVDELTRLARQIVQDAGVRIDVDGALVPIPVSVAVIADISEYTDADEVLDVAERTSQFANARDRRWEVAPQRSAVHGAVAPVELGELERQVHLRLTPVVTMPAGGIAGLLAEPVASIDNVERVGIDLYRSVDAEQKLALYRWTIRTALDAVAKLRARSNAPSDLWIQVALEARAIDTPEVIDEIVDALQRSGVPGEALALDLDARTAASTRKELLEKFSTLGVRICVDDIGAAISAAMRNDGGLVRAVHLASTWTEALATEFDDRRVLRAVLATADAMHLSTIASGVRTRDQRELLIDAGCRLGTGDYLGRSTSLDELAKRLERRELDAATS